MLGIHAWHSGDDWEWFGAILEGDEFTFEFEVVLKDMVEKKSQMAGRREWLGIDTPGENDLST